MIGIVLMLSLVPIQNVCGAASPLAVKNGDKWKLSRVSKGEANNNYIRYLWCTRPECKSDPNLNGRQHRSQQSSSVQIFLHRCDKFKKSNYNLLSTRGVQNGEGKGRAAPWDKINICHQHNTCIPITRSHLNRHNHSAFYDFMTYISYNFTLTRINHHSYTNQFYITGHAKLQHTA